MTAYLSADHLNQYFKDSPSSAIHLNARSLRKHQQDILSLLSRINHRFSFICISETRLSNDDKNLFGIPTYASEYCNRDGNNHGGAAIFVSSPIKYTRRTDLNISIANCESVWIEIDEQFTSPRGNKTILGCVYRSPSSSVSEFCIKLNELLATVSLENKKVVIMGDININLLDNDSPATIEYTNCFLGYGFESLISSPTRFSSGSTRTLIDHILSNSIRPQDCGILKSDITDHYSIFLRLHCHAPNHIRSFYRSVLNKDKFIELVGNVDWSRPVLMTDADAAYSAFISIIQECQNLSTAQVKCHKKYAALHNPWLTDSLLSCMRKRDNLYKKNKTASF